MKILIGVVVAFFLLIAGCGVLVRSLGKTMIEQAMEAASKGEADVKLGEDGKMTVTTKDGSYSMGKGLPDSWPKDLPVYPGATVQFSGTGDAGGGEQGTAAVFQTDAETSAVVKHYKDSLSTNGWSVENTMESQGMTILVATKDSRTASISIAGAEGATSITVGVQTK